MSLWYAHLHLFSVSPPPSFCDLAKGRGYRGTALRPAPAQEVNALMCAHAYVEIRLGAPG